MALPQARGKDTTFAIFDEDLGEFGNDPAAPNGFIMHLLSYGITESLELIADETIIAGRGVARPTAGDITGDGALVGNMNGTSFAKLLKHVMGSVATTGAGPYTHVFEIGDLPVSALFELDNGTVLAGPGRYEKANGRRIASADFSFGDKGQAGFTLNTMGKKINKAATPLDATLTDLGHRSFSMFSATLEENGVAFASAKTVSVKIDNELGDSSRVIGGGGEAQGFPEGRGAVSGSMAGLLTTAGQALIDKGFAGTSTSLKITLKHGSGDGSAGNESIEFMLDNIAFKPKSSEVSGVNGREFSMDFDGFESGGNLGLKITIKNAIATM
ncbi:MAG: hypothetical protein JKY93_02450 [Gammaproteobacteria bacterium]|nr:hypothetical protein [Gammaproteobacteria bacterium]